MSDNEGRVVEQTESTLVKSKVSEIDFGYHDSYIVYPGVDDSTVLNYSPDGSYIQHEQSVTLVVRSGNQQIPILCWILLTVLLLSIVTSIVIICCVCVKSKAVRKRQKRTSCITSHINGFSPVRGAGPPLEMLPKYVSSPAQSYSTQKLYQWCQQKEMQQYKSLWTVNPTSGPTSSIVHISDINDNTNAYKTRSLPSKHKQRPVSSIEDLDELYSKVNFSKKLRNRMTNDEAAIIAFCRSKSQNLSQFSGSGPKGDDAMVIYDERTAL